MQHFRTHESLSTLWFSISTTREVCSATTLPGRGAKILPSFVLHFVSSFQGTSSHPGGTGKAWTMTEPSWDHSARKELRSEANPVWSSNPHSSSCILPLVEERKLTRTVKNIWQILGQWVHSFKNSICNLNSHQGLEYSRCVEQ